MAKLNELIKNGEFDSNFTSKLDKNSFANFFEVIKKGEKSYFNICKNIYFDNTNFITDDTVSYYTIMENDTWTSISYKFYKTYKLWWLICKFNKIKDPFKQLIVGNVLVIPSQQIVDSVLSVITNN